MTRGGYAQRKEDIMAHKKTNNEFKQILDKLPEDEKLIGRHLADELIFMQETLKTLKNEINDKGVIEKFEQGKQSFFRESPALKSYNTTLQRYSQLYKQLNSMLPKKQETEKTNALYDFLKRGNL